MPISHGNPAGGYCPLAGGKSCAGNTSACFGVKLNAMSPALSKSARLYAAQDALTKAQTELANAIVAAAQNAATPPDRG